jgi:hypothetical protein
VDRPFSAFAALMTMLALAMFAVSSTNRSTTVQPAPTHNVRTSDAVLHDAVQHYEFARQSSVSRLATSPRVQGGRTVCGNCALETVVLYTGRSRLLPAAHTCTSLSRPESQSSRAQITLSPARIDVAKAIAATARLPEPIELRSFHDPIYDRIVYGNIAHGTIAPGNSDTTGKSTRPPEGRANSGDVTSVVPTGAMEAEAASIFQELFTRTARPASPSPAILWPARFDRFHATLAAAGCWLKYQLAGSPAQDCPHAGKKHAAANWDDYAEFSPTPARQAALTRSAAGNSAPNFTPAPTVRSSGSLRHSAAAGLYHIGSLLQAAADGLNEPDSAAGE